jgi:response regulator RpfG family c-di-GMP phosphodiesterase
VLGIGSAIGATGMLIALAVGVMNLWAIPVFCAPLLLTQLSFRRFTAIRATYRQTVRSLSRTTELGGYTPEGHARRVSDLALAVGRELGLGEADLLDLEYAALMHDLGQLSLDSPVHGGATIYVDPGEQRRLAEEAAKVVRATGVPAAVAEIVERQAEPYRRPHEAIDPTLPLGARILKVANAFDDLAGDAPARDAALSALERLRHGMAYDYDPRVVEVLSGVVARAG